MIADDMDRFLTQWDDLYLRGQGDIPIFDPSVTGRWSREQQQEFVRTLYHVHAHFGEVLWALGSAVPSAAIKNIVLDNIRDEFGGAGSSHETLYLELARELGVELEAELVHGKSYLPFLRQYNDLQVHAIRTGDPTTSIIGFAVGERLDHLDHSALRRICESFRMPAASLRFFDAHIEAEHFEGALAGELRKLWLTDRERVQDVFAQIRHFQLAMWDTLSSHLCNPAGTARSETGAPSTIAAAGVSAAAVASDDDGDGDGDTVAREVQFDLERSPALSRKFGDVVALDTGDAGHLQLRLDDDARAVIAESVGERSWGRDVLILGANGFAGGHILHRLLGEPRVQRVVAVARPRAGLDPLKRILTTWARYELDPAVVDLTKLEVHVGSLAERRFGLAPATYERLTSEIDTVLHCAGETDYVPPYLELRQNWVLGLLGVLQFCVERRAKQLSYLGSTIAHLYSEPRDFQRPDSWWFSGYTQMKWVNQLIVRRMAEHGLRATVCEAPYILGSTSVGKDPGFHYSLWRSLRIGAALQLAWDGPLPDFAPVDVLAAAMVANALADNPAPIVRPVPSHDQRMVDFAHLLRCKVVSWPQFIAAVAGFATPQQLRMISDDLPALIERTNLPAIFPPGFDLGLLPEPHALAKLYLSKLSMI